MHLNNEPILQGVVNHLNLRDFGEYQFTAATDPDKYAAGLIIVEPIQTPIPESKTWDGGHDTATVIIQVTAITANPSMARAVGDIIRTVLAGKSGRAYTYPLSIPGHTITSVESNGDGHTDNDGSTSQWAERFTIHYQ